MKIRIEIEDNLTEEEIIIRSGSLNAKVQMIQKAIAEAVDKEQKMSFFKGDTEYYLQLAEILFFETEDGEVWRFSGFERVNVKINQSIKEGEVLGSVGTSSGSSIDISLL